MTRHFYTAAGVVALSGIAFGAQTTSPTQPPSTTMAGASQQVTVTGCVQSWTQTGSTTPGTPSQSASQSMNDIRFKLTDAETKDATMSRGGSTMPGTTGATGAPGSTGTSGTTGGAARMGDGAMDHDEYLLRAEGASVNLSQHLNHKVEVTGRVAASMSHAGTTGTSGSSGSTGSTGTGTTGTTPRTGESGASTMRSAAGNAPVLTVSSIKMIAATCK